MFYIHFQRAVLCEFRLIYNAASSYHSRFELIGIEYRFKGLKERNYSVGSNIERREKERKM